MTADRTDAPDGDMDGGESSDLPDSPAPAKKSGGLTGWMKNLFGHKNGESVRDALEEIIVDTMDQQATIDAHERILIGNVLRQRSVTAWDVMVPRADIISVEESLPPDQVLDQLVKEGHSRMPVYRGTLDDVIGMVHIKDLALAMSRQEASGEDAPVKLPDVVRPVLFVSPSMRVLDLLLEMRLKRTHMAMVIDEYGGIDGLVTIEDAVEQIVGEIEDEHDEGETHEVSRRSDGSLVVDARMPLKEFETRFGEVFDEQERTDIDTLGGLVFRLSGRVPARRELIAHKSGLEFEVLEADPRRIRRVRILHVDDAVKKDS